MVVPLCSFNFKNAFGQIQNGNVERTATQVEHKNGMRFIFIKSIRQCGCRRFIDDTQYFQTGNRAGIFCSLALAVCKIRRHCDDGFFYFFTQVCFRILFELLQNHRGNFLRRIRFVIDVYFIIGAHVTFNGTDCTIRIGYRLTFRKLSH